jgi:hypothetical protein
MGEKRITSSTLGKYSFDHGMTQEGKTCDLLKGVQLQIRPVETGHPMVDRTAFIKRLRAKCVNI